LWSIQKPIKTPIEIHFICNFWHLKNYIRPSQKKDKCWPSEAFKNTWQIWYFLALKVPFHTQNFKFIFIEVETRFCIKSHYNDLRGFRLGIFLLQRKMIHIFQNLWILSLSLYHEYESESIHIHIHDKVKVKGFINFKRCESFFSVAGYTSFSVAILAYFKTFLHKESYVFIEIQNS